MITIINYGMGNLGSINNMFKKIGVKSIITSDIDEIKKSKKIVLPGVGSFDVAMEKINNLGIRKVLDKKVLIDKTPILGICLGMQLLTNSSEEGVKSGLGWINGKAINFKNKIDKKLKIPHMGWNSVKIVNKSPFVNDCSDMDRYYFVHSYFVKVKNNSNSLMKTNYGIDFDSAIVKNNIYGTQFHPEKSHKYGIKLFKNFSKI